MMRLKKHSASLMRIALAPFFMGLTSMLAAAYDPPTVTTEAASDVTTHHATLHATVNPHGQSTFCYFQYGTTTNYELMTEGANVGGTNAVPVSDVGLWLNPGTLYHVRILVFANQEMFPGQDVTFTTPETGAIAVVASGDAAAGAGSKATFKKFGAPILNASGDFAFRGTLASNGKNDHGIWTKIDGSLSLIALEGGKAPDTSAHFATFSDPVFNANGKIAFVGTLEPESGVKPGTASGIWSDVRGKLSLVVRQGQDAPTVSGATFGSFISMALPDAGGPVFMAKLKGGKPANSISIWTVDDQGALSLVARTGVNVMVRDAPKTISMLQFLPPVKGVNGQSRGFNRGGGVTFLASFTDHSQAVFGGSSVYAATGDIVWITDAPLTNLRQPAVADYNGIVFAASLGRDGTNVTAANDRGIFRSYILCTTEVQSGDDAPGTSGAKFGQFGDPVLSGGSLLAFAATLNPVLGGVTAGNSAGIWSNVSGSLSLIARQGSQADGAPIGVLYSNFSELALPAYGGPVFLAQLKYGQGLNGTNNIGLFGSDKTGTVSLLLRTGDAISVNGESKTVKLMQFLPSVRTVPGQTRGFNSDGYLLFRVMFTDRTEAIVEYLR